MRNDLLVLNVDDVDEAPLDDGLCRRFGGTFGRLLIIARLLWLILLLVDHLVGKKVSLRLRDGDDIISGARLEEHRVLLTGALHHSIAVHVHARAELPPIEVSQKRALARPYLDAALLEREELFLLVEEDEGLGRREVRSLPRSLVLAIDNLERVPARLEHYPLVELLEELYFAPCLVEADFH